MLIFHLGSGGLFIKKIVFFAKWNFSEVEIQIIKKTNSVYGPIYFWINGDIKFQTQQTVQIWFRQS